MLKLYQICSYSFKNDAVCKYRFSTINILPKACFSDLLRKKNITNPANVAPSLSDNILGLFCRIQ